MCMLSKLCCILSDGLHFKLAKGAHCCQGDYLYADLHSTNETLKTRPVANQIAYCPCILSLHVDLPLALNSTYHWYCRAHFQAQQDASVKRLRAHMQSAHRDSRQCFLHCTRSLEGFFKEVKHINAPCEKATLHDAQGIMLREALWMLRTLPL